MVHVTEHNVGIIDTDLLIHECLNADQGKPSFVFIISPFVSDFRLEASWLLFASNLVDVSDVDNYIDLVELLRRHNVTIHVVARSPRDLTQSSISRNFIKKHVRALRKLSEMGCEVRTNSTLHAKATVTSRGVLSGSFNLTKSGRMFNLEAGFYFPNTSGVQKSEYDDKLAWAKDVFSQSEPLDLDQLRSYG